MFDIPDSHHPNAEHLTETCSGALLALLALVQFRRRKGLTVDDVPARLGMPPAVIAEFERHDAVATLAMMRRYAHAIGVRFTSTVKEGLR